MIYFKLTGDAKICSNLSGLTSDQLEARSNLMFFCYGVWKFYLVSCYYSCKCVETECLLASLLWALLWPLNTFSSGFNCVILLWFSKVIGIILLLVTGAPTHPINLLLTPVWLRYIHTLVVSMWSLLLSPFCDFLF